MKIEITLKSGVQFVFPLKEENFEWLVASTEHSGFYTFDDGSLVLATEIAAIRRIEEATQTFEPVSNDPEQVYERELEKKKERWER